MSLRLTTMLVVICLVLMSGCADQVKYVMPTSPLEVGFWYGVWHGMILPFSLVGSFFSDDIAIYAVYNSGGWYDWGFFLGVGTLGSSTTIRR